MADPSNTTPLTSLTPSRSASRNRPRAPTITIDTSAGDPGHTNNPHSLSDQNIELRPAASFDSSRPTSPHNVLSPPPEYSNGSGTYLQIPSSGARSRGDSFDSSEAEQSPASYSSTTAVNTSSSEAETARDVVHSSHAEVLSDEEALKPDPGTEEDFIVQDNKFAFSPGQLSKLINPKSLGAFHALGGLDGLEKGLRTDRKTGLSVDEHHLEGHVSFEEAVAGAKTARKGVSPYDGSTASSTPPPEKSSDASFADRKRVFKENRLPERKSKSFLQLAWMAYNDKVLILLTVAAVISLALGLYQTFGQEHPPGAPAVEWVEGVAIMVAIIIVVVVGAVNDWQKERQFVKLNKKKEDRSIKVIRSGRTQEISVYDILVGDLVLLEPGDMIPVDGIFIEGSGVKCDESSATGESDLLKKTPADEVYRAMEANRDLKKMDPFILSGGKVTEGVGKFLVTAVGVNSAYGKTMMSLREGNEVTPLQAKLNLLAEYIAKLGGSAALVLFFVLLIKFLAQLRGSTATPAQKGQNFLNILIVAITVVVVAVPEGLPLAVTLALAFATTRMLKDNNLVRVLRSCETMGNATTVCSDKTGTLTQNKMTVVAGTLGTTSQFGDSKSRSSSETLSENSNGVSPAEVIKILDEDVKSLLEQSIVINSTAFEGEEDGRKTFIGSKTETALLEFAREYLGMGPLNIERENADIVQVVPFDSARKCMAAVVRLQNGKYRMYVKGASEILLGKCTKIIKDPTQEVSDVVLSEDVKESLGQTISTYASRSLRTIALTYRDFEQWPPKNAKKAEGNSKEADIDDLLKDMTFLGVVGIQDPLRPGVKDAVQACQKAGVFVRMVTGDNMLTAKAIAQECGIYTEGGVVMEGPTFRNLSKADMYKIIPRLQVLARSSPEDKRTLVKRLKEMGETVAVTGDGTNDAPALKTADVGFSMGIAGTEVAKEASDIILMDDNFASIVKALMWGRAVNDAVQKFLQFQLTVNITAVLLTFISAVSSDEEESVLTAVQLLWVNLIMDTFAALALATDPPTLSILNRKPAPKSAPLITVNMWKMIIGQAVYQLTVTLVFFFAGRIIFNYHATGPLGELEGESLDTFIFNTFVWMQIFNEFNNRRLDNKYNIFEGIHRNYFFIFINAIMIGGQIMIIFVGGAAFQVRPINGLLWGVSIALGFGSIPVGILIRTIPDKYMASLIHLTGRLIPKRFKRKAKPDLTVEDEQYEWNPALLEIREELTFMKKWRGGRLNNLKFKVQHPREALHLSRSGTRSRADSSPPRTPKNESVKEAVDTGSPLHPSPGSKTHRRGRSRSNSAAFGPAAAMAGIVAGSIAGWSPIERREGDGDHTNLGKNFGKDDLEAQPGVEVHPDTKKDDPVLTNDSTHQGTQNDKAPSQRQETTPGFGQGPLAGSPTKHKE